MQTLDLSTSLAPVINISGVPTDLAITKARTCERVSITIDHIPDVGKMVLPIRIIEGMERIVDRGTVSERQAFLIGSLFDLMMSCPMLRA